ncbi:hypothetical protein Q4610_13905 [Sphingobium sp. HBC34]|uniref:Uncharacterized protein n=1 Tax=Sphingobium cyanobacteriorum TaxID=3063954 RepID=A0ABT8ZR04_9SPHN|nr:hypothetical protein [Sphingobium sp. HBC34]MDO7836140.1 hypothetical protein [Sphingobium sp. HBC34]
MFPAIKNDQALLLIFIIYQRLRMQSATFKTSEQDRPAQRRYTDAPVQKEAVSNGNLPCLPGHPILALMAGYEGYSASRHSAFCLPFTSAPSDASLCVGLATILP